MYQFILGCLACLAALVGPVHGAGPASVADAVAKLDLVTLPLPPDSETPATRREASLTFYSAGASQQAYYFVSKEILKRGWKLRGDPQIYDQYISADYLHDNFALHLSVSPHRELGVGVTLVHLGNVPLRELPVPSEVEVLNEFPAVLSYKSAQNADATAAACREAMLSAGWEPYGKAGDVAYYRNRAVKASVRVVSAPNEGAGSHIDLSTELMSAALPAPPFADNFNYSDITTAIIYDCDETEFESAAFYKRALAPLGWRATTDAPVEIDWEKVTILRNADQDMLTIKTHKFEGRTRTHVRLQNAAEVAAEELSGLIEAGKKATFDRHAVWQNVAVPRVAKATHESLEKWAVRFPLASEQAFEAAQTLVVQLAAQGWTLSSDLPEGRHLREFRLEGKDRTLHILGLATPRRGAWVAVIGTGGVEFSVTP
ncbi:MAG: hypothetical protein KDA61_05700 [Planctomycetales bacterium]|nr:hypothetical protein [Planctomycetales bacterium]